MPIVWIFLMSVLAIAYGLYVAMRALCALYQNEVQCIRFI